MATKPYRRNKHDKTGVWYIRYRRAGKYVCESAKTTDYAEAVKLLKQREGAIAEGKPTYKATETATFAEGAAAILDDYEAHGYRSRHEVVRRIAKKLAPFFAPDLVLDATTGDPVSGGGRAMATITTDEIKQFVKIETRAGRSNADINRTTSVLKRMFTLMYDAGRVPVKPKISNLNERDNVRQGFFEREQFDAVCALLPAWLRIALVFAYVTGWRFADEVLRIEWAQVDLVAQSVRLQSSKSGRGRVIAYGQHPELVAVITEAAALRDAHRAAGRIVARVFVDAEGAPLAVPKSDRYQPRKGRIALRLSSPVKQAWRAATVAAGLPGMFIHDMRRSAVRNMLRAGVLPKAAMGVSGHETPLIFERYNIVNEAELAGVLGRLAGHTAPTVAVRVDVLAAVLDAARGVDLPPALTAALDKLVAAVPVAAAA